MIINLLVLLPLAAVLGLIGVGGWRNAESLSFVPGMAEERVAKRARVMRRGVEVCGFFAAVFVVFAVIVTLRVL